MKSGPGRDGHMQQEETVGDERQDRYCGDWLARRRNAKQRVLPHDCTTDRLVAEHRRVDVCSPADDSDKPSHLTRLDVMGKRIGHRGRGHWCAFGMAGSFSLRSCMLLLFRACGGVSNADLGVLRNERRFVGSAQLVARQG